MHDEDHAKLHQEHASSCGDNNNNSKTSNNSNSNNRMINNIKNLHCEMHNDSNAGFISYWNRQTFI